MTVADFTFYLFAISVVVGGLAHRHGAQPGALGPVADPGLPVGGGAVRAAGAEFVAMLLIIVYVGAVAVLFLFVVMMLDVDFASLKAEMAKYMPLAGLIGVVLLMQLALAYGTWTFSDGIDARLGNPTPPLSEVHNTQALGLILYDRYFLLFQLSG
jgi:NADH-quinone oxidoreductase subunit J